MIIQQRDIDNKQRFQREREYMKKFLLTLLECNVVYSVEMFSKRVVKLIHNSIILIVKWIQDITYEELSMFLNDNR